MFGCTYNKVCTHMSCTRGCERQEGSIACGFLLTKEASDRCPVNPSISQYLNFERQVPTCQKNRTCAGVGISKKVFLLNLSIFCNSDGCSILGASARKIEHPSWYSNQGNKMLFHSIILYIIVYSYYSYLYSFKFTYLILWLSTLLILPFLF